MLTGAAAGRLADLDRLASRRGSADADGIDWQTPIDRTRWYFCETLTPLFYTPMYRELEREIRRRYNQLTGMLATEIIALLETEFLDATLAALARERDTSPMLHAAAVRFRDDERRHAAIWRKLNELSEPAWYHDQTRHLVRVPLPAAALSRLLARHPIAFPVVFWIQLVQEERSVEISRRCMRVPADRIEPRYAAALAAHIQDEIRHVQIDRHLIERFYRSRSAAVRWCTARLLRTIIGSLLLAPVRSTVRVVQILASEYPEIRPLLPRIRRELRALVANDEYQHMMYSRQTTPVTFALFDEFEEFHGMSAVLRGYQPRLAGRDSIPSETVTLEE